MRVTFLGVGEACDAWQPNTALLVEAGQQAKTYYILCDCGFTTPHRYFQLCDDGEQLDAVWISHFHGDHFFGLPLLLLRFWEMGRRRPLRILGQRGIENKVAAAMELAFPSFMGKLRYPVDYGVVEPGRPQTVDGIRWATAENDHSQRALAVRIEADRVLYYSGDGRPTAAAATLAAGCDLLVHEAFRYAEDTPSHGSVVACLDFAGRAEAQALALVHVERTVRRLQKPAIIRALEETRTFRAFLPESGEVVEV